MLAIYEKTIHSRKVLNISGAQRFFESLIAITVLCSQLFVTFDWLFGWLDVIYYYIEYRVD